MICFNTTYIYAILFSHPGKGEGQGECPYNKLCAKAAGLFKKGVKIISELILSEYQEQLLSDYLLLSPSYLKCEEISSWIKSQYQGVYSESNRSKKDKSSITIGKNSSCKTQ